MVDSYPPTCPNDRDEPKLKGDGRSSGAWLAKRHSIGSNSTVFASVTSLSSRLLLIGGSEAGMRGRGGRGMYGTRARQVLGVSLKTNTALHLG